MTPKRIYWAMIGINLLLVAAIVSCVVLGDGILKKQSDGILAKKLESAVLDQEQIALNQAKQDLENYAELNNIAKQIVPQEKDQALITREILSIAQKSGVNIGSISFPASTLGSGANGSATTGPATTGISQAKPVTGIKDLLELKITVTSESSHPSSYDQVITFLSNLENNRRTAQVSQLNIQPDARDPNLVGFTLTLTVYIKP